MIKTILVHLLPDRESDERVKSVLPLARALGAHVSGVYTIEPYAMPAVSVGRSASGTFLAEMRHMAERKASECERTFSQVCSAAGVAADWRAERGPAVEMLAQRMHYADLAVVGQSAPRSLEEAFIGYPPDHLAMLADGPVIIVPSGFAGPIKAERILLGWKPCREAGRAVRDALPLLARAKVTVLSVGATPTPHDSARELQQRLKRLGISAEVLDSPRQDDDAATVIEHIITDQKSDMLVMGAYSRSRWREILLGGVTQRMLSQTNIPVLMAR